MWSMITAFLFKNILPKILDSKWLKWVLLAIPFFVMGFFLLRAQWNYSDLKSKYDEQVAAMHVIQEDLTAAKETIRGLEADTKLKEQQATDINTLLRQCHESMQKYDEGNRQIEANMADGPVSTPLNKDAKGEQIYVPVTKEQNAAGIDFLNRQLGVVK